MGVGGTVVLIVWMLALSVYDIRQRRLPNALTLPGAVTVLLGRVSH
jgi:leader peptidase (prepilin peptidase) / N-methyltransferase